MPPCMTCAVFVVLFVVCVNANAIVSPSEDDVNQLLSLNPEFDDTGVFSYFPDGLTKDDLVDLSKRFSRGFYPARGKKINAQAFYVSRGKKSEDSLYEPDFSADDVIKRGSFSSGFTMPRGKKIPSGFQMVRGKKSAGKRNLNRASFFLARGKKSQKEEEDNVHNTSDPKADLQQLMKYFNSIRTGSAPH